MCKFIEHAKGTSSSSSPLSFFITLSLVYSRLKLAFPQILSTVNFPHTSTHFTDSVCIFLNIFLLNVSVFSASVVSGFYFVVVCQITLARVSFQRHVNSVHTLSYNLALSCYLYYYPVLEHCEHADDEFVKVSVVKSKCLPMLTYSVGALALPESKVGE